MNNYFLMERDRAMLLIFIAVIIILIVIIATPFIYKSYKETFTPPNKPKIKDHDHEKILGIKVYITGFRVETPLSLRNSTASVYAKVYADGQLVAILPNIPFKAEIDKEYTVNWSTPTIHVNNNVGEHQIKIEFYGNKKLLDINGKNASKKEGGKILVIYYYLGNVGHEESFSGDGSNDGNNNNKWMLPKILKILFMEKDAFIQGKIVTVNAAG